MSARIVLPVLFVLAPLLQQGYDPRPADGSHLKMLDVDGAEAAPAPEGGAIVRDGALTDRLTAAGQSVLYSFESEAAELSLFELEVVGYARGWQSAALMEVIDASGRVLAQRERAGGESYQIFFAFEAPAAATYSLRLSAPKTYYRYTLLRNSSYKARSVAPLTPKFRASHFSPRRRPSCAG